MYFITQVLEQEQNVRIGFKTTVAELVEGVIDAS